MSVVVLCPRSFRRDPSRHLATHSGLGFKVCGGDIKYACHAVEVEDSSAQLTLQSIAIITQAILILFDTGAMPRSCLAITTTTVPSSKGQARSWLTKSSPAHGAASKEARICEKIVAKRHMAGEDRARGTGSTKIREGARQSPNELAAAEHKQSFTWGVEGEGVRGTRSGISAF